MENKKTVLFDPGYAPIAIESLGQVGYSYYIFNAISNLKVKRLNFVPFSKKMEQHLDINVAFYLGCLLWANYIKQFKNTEIEGNKLYGEKCEQEEYTGEIDFLTDFIENKYPRDYKYFLNKTYTPDKRFLPILKAYKEFLIINKGFVECINTDDIKIPDSIKTPDKKELDKINLEIQNAISQKNLLLLLDCFDYLF